MSLVLVVRTVQPSERTVYLVLLPPLLSLRIGLSLVFWMRRLGNPIRFLPLYFKDLQSVYECLCSLGPFVAAGERIG